ncbi:hypothetical protein ABT354_03340 [Streptomyces sp. NPDC000594]|uniref:hypothetical protein n=1 Tax=Streptomyces sp. NPDC000594 TaxID=3154261 RepID=UPI003329E7FC
MRARTTTAGLVAVACAGVFLAPSSATAAEAPRDKALQGKAGTHCVTDLDTRKTTCYDTFRESVTAATGGRVTDATQARAAQDKRFVDTLNASARAGGPRAAAELPHVLAIFYSKGDYKGSTWIPRGPLPCADDGKVNYYMGGLAGGWNDAISSLQTAGNCHIRAWEHGEFAGASQYYTTSTRWVGDAMNDRISSLEWF